MISEEFEYDDVTYTVSVPEHFEPDPEPTALRLGPNALWSRSGFPHRDWSLVDTVDIQEHGHDYIKCEVCDWQKFVRFAHIMEHANWSGRVLSGCVCAARLLEDSKTVAESKKVAVNLAVKRKRDLDKLTENIAAGLVGTRWKKRNPEYNLILWEYCAVWHVKGDGVAQSWFSTIEEAVQYSARELQNNKAR